MKTVRQSHPVALLIIALTGALTACQGGDQKTTGQATTAAPPPRTSAPAPASAVDDQTAVRRLVLTKADLPAGWKIDASEDTSLPSGDITGTSHKDAAEATGKSFEKGSLAVGSSAEIVKPDDDLTMDAAMLGSSGFARTLKSEFGKAMAEGNTGATTSSASVKPLQIAKYGQYSIGYRVTSKITSEGIGIKVYMDWVWLANERSSVEVSFGSAGAPFDPALQKKLIAQLGSRLMAAR
jgi:hypothetical protein